VFNPQHDLTSPKLKSGATATEEILRNRIYKNCVLDRNLLGSDRDRSRGIEAEENRRKIIEIECVKK
jgi:hypothetical protein